MSTRLTSRSTKQSVWSSVMFHQTPLVPLPIVTFSPNQPSLLESVLQWYSTKYWLPYSKPLKSNSIWVVPPSRCPTSWETVPLSWYASSPKGGSHGPLG